MAIQLGSSGEGGGASFSNLADVYLHGRQQQAAQAPVFLPPPPPSGGYLESPHGQVTDAQMQQAADQRRLLQDQATLRQAEWSHAEDIQLQRLRGQEAQVMADPNYSDAEKADIVTQLRTRINPAQQRQQRALAAKEEAQTRLVTEQAAREQARNHVNIATHYADPANWVRDHQTGHLIGVIGPDGKLQQVRTDQGETRDERRLTNVLAHIQHVEDAVNRGAPDIAPVREGGELTDTQVAQQNAINQARRDRINQTLRDRFGLPPGVEPTVQNIMNHLRGRQGGGGAPGDQGGGGGSYGGERPAGQPAPVARVAETAGNFWRERIGTLQVPEARKAELRRDVDRVLELLRTRGPEDPEYRRVAAQLAEAVAPQPPRRPPAGAPHGPMPERRREREWQTIPDVLRHLP